MLKDYPARDFMFVQRSGYTVELRLVRKKGFVEDAGHLIRAVVAANLPGLELDITIVDPIPSTRANKQRPVVSEPSPPKGGASG